VRAIIAKTSPCSVVPFLGMHHVPLPEFHSLSAETQDIVGFLLCYRKKWFFKKFEMLLQQVLAGGFRGTAPGAEPCYLGLISRSSQPLA